MTQSEMAIMMRKMVMVLMVGLMLALQVQSKSFSTDFTVKKFKSNKGWFYLDKMVLNPGVA